MTKRLRPTRACAILAACILFAVSPNVHAAEEPKFEDLLKHFRTPGLRVTVLLQAVADLQNERSFPGHNGFSVANARLGFAGELDRGLGYLIRASLTNTPSILDARLSYSPRPTVTFDMGQFKVPFSKELLTSAGTIDFVNRAQVVSALAPGRQIGAQVRGTALERRISYSAGLWNGNSASANTNDNEAFLYAARCAVYPLASARDAGTLEIGVNGATSYDTRLALVGGSLSNFSGRRHLMGADLRWNDAPWLVSAEVLGARLEPDGAGSLEPSGFHVTAGRQLSPRLHGLLRWERFLPAGLAPDQDFVIGGVNVVASRAFGIQANYIVSTATGLEHHQFLLNAQLDF